MRRRPVDSSSIASIGYDADHRTLEIAFHNGGLYHYFDVAPEVHEGLVSADSVGRYFMERVRGRYAYEESDNERR